MIENSHVLVILFLNIVHLFILWEQNHHLYVILYCILFISGVERICWTVGHVKVL